MTFSLLTEPWLPMLAATGQHQLASLRDALLKPGRWAGLDAAHPLQCLAIYRLLLAICHRAIGPGSFDDRLELLDTWPADRIEAYLQHWAERFDLFSSDRPFMQHPIAPRAGKKEPGSKEPASLASLQIERSSGNNRTLWDRSLDSTPLRLTPAGQAITLITAQQFSGSGTVQGFRTSGSYGLASNLQLVMPVGADLQQTRALNLVLQSEEEHKLDLPCWEQELLSEKELRGNPVRVPAGPADRYTYGVRTFLLREDGLVHIAEGEIPGASPVVDPMSAVVQGSKGPMSLMLRTDRTLWRDATALLGAASSEPPAVVQHAAELMMSVGRYEPLELLAGGLVVDKGKGVAWRLEQRHLAPGLVGNAEAQAVVETLLEQASVTSKALFGATSSLCRHWLDQGSEAGADPKDVMALRSSLQADALFWGSLETEFWGALHALGDGATGDAVLEGWRQTLRLTVRMVWDHCCSQIGDDGRGLRARGKASHALGKVMAGLAAPERLA
jgi:CRISPR system Cascade subunit CasA